LSLTRCDPLKLFYHPRSRTYQPAQRGRNRMILTNWNIGLEHRRCFDSPLGQRVGVCTFKFLWSTFKTNVTEA